MSEKEEKQLVIKFKLDMEQFDSNYSYFAGRLYEIIKEITNDKAYQYSWEIRN